MDNQTKIDQLCAELINEPDDEVDKMLARQYDEHGVITAVVFSNGMLLSGRRNLKLMAKRGLTPEVIYL